MRWALAGLFVLHGVAHLVGFVAPWQLAQLDEVPYRTTVLGGTIDLGDSGIRVVGVLWLLVTLAFVAAAIGLLADRAWWRALALSVSTLSIALCALQWPESRVGVIVNAGILGVLLLDGWLSWLPVAA